MKNKGFTLVELIIVVAIIALLAAATFVAVNPAKRIGEAQNSQRWSDITSIADAYITYMADNSGVDHTNVTVGTCYEIDEAGGTNGAGDANCVASSTCAGAVGASNDLDLEFLVTGGYIGRIPYDPSSRDGTTTTGYYFNRLSNGILEVGTCTTYNAVTNIKVIR